jgi:uncharacterized phage protein (TIGR01671 family)
MNEILFRGKRIDNGEWIKGFYCQVADESDGGTRIKQTILVPTFLCQSGFKLLEVDSETIGQYTGLTDKNGRKIFEGDIVRLFDISVGEIVQECGAFGIGCRKQIDYDYLASEIAPVTGNNNTPMFCYNDNFVSLWELWWNYNEESDEISVIEVIGNIYDNPELLKVTK